MSTERQDGEELAKNLAHKYAQRTLEQALTYDHLIPLSDGMVEVKFVRIETPQQKRRIGTQIKCFKLASGDWHPCYKLSGWHQGKKDRSMVEVSLLALTDGMWRVCVWGGDYHGVEKDYGEDLVNEGWLRNEGFVTA